ncbi:class I histocompatibility antigen, F10 alpha chain-like isoform X2 [Corythoichthys intestinalis]|uniref:class I histocompatibility antigen, F10 alpha chain-like isoform X2 n=1 Tax=Corythoichthys intestinalis TaxID=161448 RepID=UPI0025A5AB40|nr:class I histocompatibility antigen, F10 alpha chain-like isoform X2 [Corythoichthys intestinalis]
MSMEIEYADNLFSVNSSYECYVELQPPQHFSPRLSTIEYVIHTLNYIQTVSFHIPNLPEYMAVGYVDGLPISHYDSESGKTKVKQEWMKNITAEEPRYWEEVTQINIANQHSSKVHIHTFQERFNQTGGLHMIQETGGCQWDDETDQVDGWTHHAYNGEDFIWFDLKGLRWIAVQPRAAVTKHEWDRLGRVEHRKHYITKICPSYLKKYVSFGRDVLMRTELPRVSLLQKTAGSPVTCHATGFYPRAAVLFWRKDGKHLDENVEMDEILPNHDGTFQTGARLLAVDEGARYECVFQLDGVPKDVVTPLDLAEVLSNERIEAQARRKTALAVAIPSVLLSLGVAITVFVVKRKQAKYTPAPTRTDTETASSRTDSPKAASSETDSPGVALFEAASPETAFTQSASSE